LGVTFTDAPAAVGRGARLHVFARGSDGALYHKAGDGSSWERWERLGGSVVSSPAAVVAGGRLTVFVRSRDDQVWTRSRDGRAWSAWTPVGGQLSEAPAAAAGDGHVELVVRGRDHRIWHSRAAGSAWEPWRSLGGEAHSAPAAAHAGPGRLIAFCRGRDRGLWHRALDSAGDRWESLGGTLESAPAAVGGDGRLEVFIRGPDGHVWAKRFDGEVWGEWTDAGGDASSAPAVTSRGADLHLFVVGPGQRVYHRRRTEGVWCGWADLGRPGDEPRIRATSHNVPSCVRSADAVLAGVRLRNDGWTPARFPVVHAAFWDQRAAELAWAVEVRIDGVLLVHAQVPGQQIAARAASAIFFPLPPLAVGRHRLELRLVRIGGKRRGIRLLAARLRVRKGHFSWGALLARAWVLVHGHLPVWKLRARWRRLQREARRGSPADRTALLKTWKGVNRELASAEKQLRCARPRSLPAYLTVDTTWHCNLACPRCFREFMPGNPNTIPDMSRAHVEEMIATLFPVAETINLSSVGEPLLSPHLETILEACRRHVVALSLTTNGTALGRPGLLERLGPLLHRIEVSIDSLRPDVFAWLRAGTSLEVVLGNLRALGELRRGRPHPRFGLGVSMTLFRENLAEVPEMLKLVAEVGGSFLKAEIGVILGAKDVDSSILRCPEAYERVRARAGRQAAALGLSLWMRPLDGRREAPGQEAPLRYGICDFLYLNANISSEGQVKPCFTPPLPEGDPSLAAATLRERWTSPGMRRLRRDHDSARAPHNCRRCYVIQNGSARTANLTAGFLRNEATP